MDIDQSTWYLGTIFFEKYFVVFNNSPRGEAEASYNEIGITHCKTHDAHVDMIEDVIDHTSSF